MKRKESPCVHAREYVNYTFKQQDKIGALGAELLDGYCSALWSLRPATMVEEKQGIDRVANNGLKLEYKTDIIGHKTGNCFIEIVASTNPRRPGWAYTTQSDIVLYFFPHLHQILFIDPLRLRPKLPHWETTYRRVSVSNRGYSTVGLLVPISVVCSVCSLVDFSKSSHPYCQYVKAKVRKFL